MKFSGARALLPAHRLQRPLRRRRRACPPGSTPGVTRGHSAAEQAFSIAAAPAADPLPFDLEPGDPPNPTGPYPGVVHRGAAARALHLGRPAADVLRRRRHARRRTDRRCAAKPDFTAADGVSTSVPDFDAVLRHLGGRPERGRHRRAGAARATRRRPPPRCARRSRRPRSTSPPPAPTTRTGRGILRADRVLDVHRRHAAAARARRTDRRSRPSTGTATPSSSRARPRRCGSR